MNASSPDCNRTTLSVLTEDRVERIHNGALQVLARTGIARSALKRSGGESAGRGDVGWYLIRLSMKIATRRADAILIPSRLESILLIDLFNFWTPHPDLFMSHR